MTIEFLGAAQEVTGSKHLITTNNGTKILLDCGLYQGKGLATDADNRDLGFNPAEINYLILSHAHIDHSGLIPYIVKLGFRGTIITTPATRDLCAIMLPDSGNIQELDTITFNKKREKQGLPTVSPIYTAEDARFAMQYFVSVPYDRELNFGTFSIMFSDNGHILGSATCNIKVFDNGKADPTRIAFTGDIGRYTGRILKQPQIFPQADYIIMETTYGDRVHESVEESEEQLLDVVKYTCIRKKGKLIIPSFAVGRSQEIISVLNDLWESGQLPSIDVYVDSPLSVNATNIFRLHTECFNERMQEFMRTDPDPFGFDKLHYIQTNKESKSLNYSSAPCIIISASGMMEAGRVKHHIANNIEKKSTTILGVGYCAPTTLGHKILRGDKNVSIFGTNHRVYADIRRIEGYSAHADKDELLRFIAHTDKTLLKKIFLVHGEHDSQIAFSETLNSAGYNDVVIPAKKDKIELD
ncbi:MAG: MBL fold metallo-hydrolase [Bacteroidales bacterium]|nr:MBL fold metallo-hydrolase [Bacteroidales bacterium]MBQ9312027.1 MBL fold metallo-hydrolase [Bacteroidales bacterium]